MCNFLFSSQTGCTKQYTVPSSTIQYQAVQWLYKKAHIKSSSFIFESAMEFRSFSVIHIFEHKMCLMKRDTSGFPASIRKSLVGVNQATQTVHNCTNGTFSGQYRPIQTLYKWSMNLHLLRLLICWWRVQMNSPTFFRCQKWHIFKQHIYIG